MAYCNLNVDYDKLNMFTLKPKATTKIIIIAGKSTKEITWNHHKTINPKDGRKRDKRAQRKRDNRK